MGETMDVSGDRKGLSGKVIGACLEVHSILGPGLLESIYEEALAFELKSRGIQFVRQKSLPVTYKGILLEGNLRIDMLVEDQLVLELKSCESLAAIHLAQLFTYLKLSGKKLGLLINFNSKLLKEGIKRVILN